MKQDCICNPLNGGDGNCQCSVPKEQVNHPQHYGGEDNPYEAIKVIDAWGFTYKTVGFTWAKSNKTNMGMFTGLGYWTRSNPEMCLLATKGKPKRVSKSVAQLVIDQRREHSRKPDRIRNDIIELCGDLPRIELFARQTFDGWDAWGNEV